MAKSNTTQLVVDANIAKAAGLTEHPTSIHSRKFLESVRDLRCSLGFSPDLTAEWDKHQSIFSSQWRSAMESKGLLIDLDPPEIKELRDVLFEATELPLRRTELMKDAHLIEAALIFGKRIASNERVAREWFAKISQLLTMGNLCWVNPDQDCDEVLKWLQQGAPLESKHQLKNFTKQSRPRKKSAAKRRQSNS